MERRHPISDFDSNQFREFFGKQTNALEARLLSGGACNSNYSVLTPTGSRFVCRIHHRGHPRVEKAVVELLSPSIPSPEYLWVGEGVSVMTFIEGSHFRPTKNLVREAGQMIARLSAITLERSGQILASGEVTPFDGWDTLARVFWGSWRKIQSGAIWEKTLSSPSLISWSDITTCSSPLIVATISSMGTSGPIIFWCPAIPSPEFSIGNSPIPGAHTWISATCCATFLRGGRPIWLTDCEVAVLNCPTTGDFVPC